MNIPDPKRTGPTGAARAPGQPRSADPAPPVAPPLAPGEIVDRRTGLDRRHLQENDDSPSGLERRRGPGRRRSDFLRSAEEGEMNKEQFLFLLAIDTFKRTNGKTFPTWTDVLEIVRLLGYRKTMPSELALPRVEDWTEKPDTPSNVRTQAATDDE